MFSEAGFAQEVVALAAAAAAFVFMVHRITGWPRRRKKPTANVVLGSRLERGLARARDGERTR